MFQVENLRNASCYVLGVITITVPASRKFSSQGGRKNPTYAHSTIYAYTCHRYNVLNMHSVLISVTDRN